MNVFEKHGIKHLSPSSLRTYREEPALWVLQYLHGIRDEGGPGAWRGTAVEAGMDMHLFGTSENATKAMHLAFEERAAGVADTKTENERAALPQFLNQAREALKDRPMPLHRQHKINLTLPGIEVPLIGFADWVWPEYGVDLKTTMRMPSEPGAAHVEQMACYMRATGKPFHLCYVTPKKWALHEVSKEMADEAMEGVIRGARAIRQLLALVDNKDDALTLFSPEMEGYRWSPEIVKAANNIYTRIGAMP